MKEEGAISFPEKHFQSDPARKISIAITTPLVNLIRNKVIR